MAWLQHLCALLWKCSSCGPDKAENRGRSYEAHAAEHDWLTRPPGCELGCGGCCLEGLVNDVSYPGLSITGCAAQRRITAARVDGG